MSATIQSSSSSLVSRTVNVSSVPCLRSGSGHLRNLIASYGTLGRCLMHPLPSMKGLELSRQHAGMPGSSLCTIRIGRISPLSTSSTQSPPVFCINCTKGLPNISSHGSKKRHRRSMIAVVTYPRTIVCATPPRGSQSSRTSPGRSIRTCAASSLVSSLDCHFLAEPLLSALSVLHVLDLMSCTSCSTLPIHHRLFSFCRMHSPLSITTSQYSCLVSARTLSSPNFTCTTTINVALNFLALQTITVHNSLSAYTLTSPRMPSVPLTAKTRSLR